MKPPADHPWNLFRQGDRSAFERIYFAHVNSLYDYGIRLTRNAELVEDCIQDLFLEMWTKRVTVSEVHSVRSYLLVSLRRKIVRKLAHEQTSTVLYKQVLYADSPTFDPYIEQSDAEEEKLTSLHQAFAKLSEKQKEVVYLRFYNQLSYAEIAEVMSVQVKAVYKLMARAIQVLRKNVETPELALFLIAILTS